LWKKQKTMDKKMNVYVATRNNMVGLVLTGTHNKIYHFKAFETETNDKETQTLLATRRAVCFAKSNNVLYAGNEINLYTNDNVDLEKFRNDEYLSRFNYPIEHKQANTDEEKHHLRLASTEIEMESRRLWIRKDNCR
jgi:hypothetical protein